MKNKQIFSPGRLREAITERNLKVAEVAVGIRVNPATLYNWLKGKGSPDAAKLADIANYLEKSASFFFDRVA